MYRAFYNNGGWYVAWEDESGTHYQPDGGGRLAQREAQLEAREENAAYEADLAQRESALDH